MDSEVTFLSIVLSGLLFDDRVSVCPYFVSISREPVAMARYFSVIEIRCILDFVDA